MAGVLSRAIQSGRRLGVWVDQWLYKRPIVLCYHRIASETVDPFALAVSPQRFAEHLEVLRRSGRRIVPLSQIWNGGRPQKNVVAVTFDDGYADNLHVAKGILGKYDSPATIFVATGNIGSESEFWWDELDRIFDCPELPSSVALDGPPFRMEATLGRGAREHSPRAWRVWEPATSDAQRFYRGLYEYLRPLDVAERSGKMAVLRQQFGWSYGTRPVRRSLSWAELEQLFASSTMQPGGHTVNHVDLSATDPACQKIEIEVNKRDLADRTGRPVTEFAFPYGCYGDDSAALLRKAGFSLAFTTATRGIRPSSSPFQMPRYCVHDWDGDEFGYRLAL